MFATVTTAQFKPGMVEKAIPITLEQFLPALKQQKGFRGYISARDGQSGVSTTMILWDSAESREAFVKTTFRNTYISQLTPLLTEPIKTELRDVVNVIMPGD